nr:hypothetical protein BgiMline_026351 [Biomphalaria glabrata]
MDKVQVAVRVRPVNKRERDLNTKCIVDMEGSQTILHPIKDSFVPQDAHSLISVLCIARELSRAKRVEKSKPF